MKQVGKIRTKCDDSSKLRVQKVYVDFLGKDWVNFLDLLGVLKICPMLYFVNNIRGNYLGLKNSANSKAHFLDQNRNLVNVD